MKRRTREIIGMAIVMLVLIAIMVITILIALDYIKLT